ncbi:hypothetical protein [Kribbella catacumbae]|uniref:hypothetical protein n=1 Tax=Kribbella catacumbae TaxID=460086 RepID=UPI0003A8612A|nr:hypothetical protein [Kribbella catacumbae]
MGAYMGMELNTMAGMLNGQRAEPWHASSDIWGSACQQLLATHGDLAAANGVITSWPQSIGSVAQAAFSGQVIGSHASLAEWSVYTGAMSAALRLGGTALNLAQAVMPGLQSGYNTAVALSSVPFIGPFAAQAAAAINVAGAGMMEAVGVVMQAPTAVPTPTQGWQGPGGSLNPLAASTVSLTDISTVLDAAGKVADLAGKGLDLAQSVAGLAQSSGLGKELEGLGDLPQLGTQPISSPDLPSLAGGVSIGAPSLNSPGGGGLQLPGNVIPPAALVASIGGLPAVATMRSSVVGARPSLAELGTRGTTGVGVPGARIAAGTEPALAGGAARAAAAGAAKSMPAIAPPVGHGAGSGGTNEIRPGRRRGAGSSPDEQADLLQRNGVQAELQGRAAREPAEQFGLPSARRRKPGADGAAILDDELFVADYRRD